jgi:hypothetical protein
MSQRGGISFPIVIAAVLGLGFGASAYLNYAQHAQAMNDKKLLQGQITDLQYQVKQDQLAKASSPSPTPSDSPTPTPSATPAVAGTTSITVSQYGVKLTATDPITDLTYAPIASGGLTVAGFTTQSLLAKYPACKPGTALGMLVRRPKTQKPPVQDKLIKAIGSYNYYFVAATGNCTGESAGANILAADRAAIANSVMPTLN